MNLKIAIAPHLRRWSSVMWRCHTPSSRLAYGAHLRFLPAIFRYRSEIYQSVYQSLLVKNMRLMCEI